MRLFLQYWIVFVSSFVLAPGFANGQRIVLPNGNDLDDRNIEYYFAFTEATKFYVFEDFQSSIRLYQECLKYNPGSAAVFYQLGNILEKTGDRRFASGFFRRAYSIDSENVWYAKSLADSYFAAGKFDSVCIIYGKLIRSYPNHHAVRFELARALLLSGFYSDAWTQLNFIEQAIGSSKEMQLLKYEVLMNKNKYRKAELLLDHAMRIDPTDPLVMKKRAEFFVIRGKSDSASIWYRRAYEHARYDAGIVFSYADFLKETFQGKKMEEVLVDFMQSDSVPVLAKRTFLAEMTTNRLRFEAYREVLDTVSETYLNHLSDLENDLALYIDIQFRLGKFEKSAAVLKKFLKKNPLHSSAHEQLLFALNYLNQPDSLEKYAEETRRIYAERPISYLFLGSTCYRKAKYRESIDYLTKGVALTDNRALQLEFYSLMAESYSKMGFQDKAVECYRSALKADEDNLAVNNNYAYLLAVMGIDLKNALKMSFNCIENDPKNDTYLDTHAWVLFKLNDTKEALKFIRRALKYGEDDHAEILDHCGDILFASGKKKQALKFWNRAFLFSEGKEKIAIQAKIAENERR